MSSKMTNIKKSNVKEGRQYLKTEKKINDNVKKKRNKRQLNYE